MFVNLLKIKILAKHEYMLQDENFSLETKWRRGKLSGFSEQCLFLIFFPYLSFSKFTYHNQNPLSIHLCLKGGLVTDLFRF